MDQRDDSNDNIVDSLLGSIEAELSKLAPISPKRCIFKVPTRIRAVNEGAYTPVVVSIVPFHHRDKKLVPMKAHKLNYLQSFIDGSQSNADLKTYLKCVKDAEARIREFYADPTTKLSTEEFTQMVLVDSAFLIELFRKNFNFKQGNNLVYLNQPPPQKDDHVCGRPYKMGDVIEDIKLLENQLPFFILKDLYWTAFNPNGSTIPYFTDLACRFLRVDKSKIDIDANTQEASSSCCHLLDLVRTQHLPSKRRGDQGAIVTRRERNIMSPSVTSLYEKFKVADQSNSCGSLLDIQFDGEKGILTIPHLKLVDHRTESLFRNMVAFELCYYKNDTYVTDYQFFMDFLINTPRDMELLVDANIVENWLGSEKNVARLFNTLGKHIYVFPYTYYYAGISEQLNSYCNKRCNRYRAILKHTYFKHPWAVISVIYAAILLILTAIQVVLAIISIP